MARHRKGVRQGTVGDVVGAEATLGEAHEAAQASALGSGCGFDVRAQWIADGLGVSAPRMRRTIGGTEAGDDAGEVFFMARLLDATVAVRADGMRAYVTGVDETAEPRLGDLLSGHGLVDVTLPVGGTGVAQSLRWLKVASGRPPVAGRCTKIEYAHPGGGDRVLPVDHLSTMSMALGELLGDPVPDWGSIRNVRALAVTPGDVLARAVSASRGESGEDVFGRRVAEPMRAAAGSLETGPYVSLSDEGEYRAERYGYMALLEGRLSVIPPVWVDAEEMHAYWVVLDDRPHAIASSMVHQHLADMGVMYGVRDTRIEALARQLREGGQRRGLFAVAVGQPPQHGLDAHVEMFVDTARRSGTEREDGSIDFREVNFTPSVTAGQLLATSKPPSRGQPGMDVKGVEVAARDGEDRTLQAGENVRVASEGKSQQFYATVDGAVTLSGSTVTVVQLLAIRGDVSFNTGNLDFGGEIFIDGSVVQGFTVKAGGNVSVSGTVEPGAQVSSGADVSVGRGIVGRRTKVWAKGSVRAQFVQEATVSADQDIVLGSFAYHARLRAGGRVAVSRTTGSRSGSIMGGRTWARAGMEAYVAGSTGGTPTPLVAGLGPDEARVLDRTERDIESTSGHMQRLLEQFGLEHVYLDHIRNMIRAATGPRRKLLANRARQLGEFAQQYHDLLADRRRLRDELDTDAERLEIRVYDTAFPGVSIRIGEYQCKLSGPVGAARFHVDGERLVER